MCRGASDVLGLVFLLSASYLEHDYMGLHGVLKKSGDRCRRAGFARPCAGAVAEGAWEKPRRPHDASLQPVPARRKSGARRACLSPDRDTLCTRTGGDARGHAAHGHGGASSVQDRGREDERASGLMHWGRLQPV